MKRYFIFIILAIIVLIVGIAIFFNQNSAPSNTNNSQTISNTSADRTSANVNEEIAENRISNIIANRNEILSSTTNETEISAYATTIKDQAEGRLTNINITCSILNNTIVRNGSTFSFNEIIGEPTAERGYQEASIIVDHKTEKGIGGRKLPSK